MHRQAPDLWDKTFKDRDGNYVIFQMPNIWIIGWAVLTLISLFTVGTLSSIFSWIGTGFLAVWSVLEIASGVNYFRRVLGLVVFLYVIASVITGLK